MDIHSAQDHALRTLSSSVAQGTRIVRAELFSDMLSVNSKHVMKNIQVQLPGFFIQKFVSLFHGR